MLKLLAIGAVLMAVPAIAEEASQRAVSYHDLDLAQVKDVARLDRRIATAARSVCGAADPRDLGMTAAVERCRSAAVADASSRREMAVAAARSGQQQAYARSAIPVAR